MAAIIMAMPWPFYALLAVGYLSLIVACFGDKWCDAMVHHLQRRRQWKIGQSIALAIALWWGVPVLMTVVVCCYLIRE